MKTKLTKDEKKFYLDRMIWYIRNCEDGTDVSAAQLLDLVTCGRETFSEDEIKELTGDFFDAAKKTSITLDMSAHDGLFEGLLHDMDFVVRNGNRKGVCPYCGSRKAVPIMYGMPAFSEELKQKLDNEEIELGGCVITGMDPAYRCKACGKKFGIFSFDDEEDDY